MEAGVKFNRIGAEYALSNRDDPYALVEDLRMTQNNVLLEPMPWKRICKN
jgi:hypothetical protein